LFTCIGVRLPLFDRKTPADHTGFRHLEKTACLIMPDAVSLEHVPSEAAKNSFMQRRHGFPLKGGLHAFCMDPPRIFPHSAAAPISCGQSMFFRIFYQHRFTISDSSHPGRIERCWWQGKRGGQEGRCQSSGSLLCHCKPDPRSCLERKRVTR